MLFSDRTKMFTRLQVLRPDRVEDRADSSVGVCNQVVQKQGPSLWVDALDIQAAGDVQTWPAKVGTSPTQATVAKRPEWQAAGWARGGAAVAFDNVGECMQTSTPNLNGGQKYTIASTYKAGDTTSHRIVAEYNTDWATTNGCALQQTNGTGVVLGSQGDGANYRYSTSGSDTSGQEICAIITSDRGVAGAGMGAAYVNGVNVSNFNVTSGADPAGNFGTSTWNIGSRNNGAARPLDGCIRELVVYADGIKSASDVGDIDVALRWKAKCL